MSEMKKRRNTKADKREAVADVLVAYRRVSTEEQAASGASLHFQEQQLTDWAAANGKTLIWLTDDGYSAGSMDRPAVQQALELVRTFQAGGIVVTKLDRLSRSMLDFCLLMDESQKSGWDIVALDFGLDTSTPAGKMMVGILALFAEFERNLIKQRTRDGLAAKKAMGVQIGRRRQLSDESLDNVLGIWLRCDRNYSWACEQVNKAEIPTAQGGKRWYPSTVRAVVYSADGQARLAQIEQEVMAA